MPFSIHADPIKASMRQIFVRCTARRLGFFSPPILIVALVTSMLMFATSGLHLTLDDRSNTLRTLLQISSMILGVNMIGLTINTNQFGQSAGIRSLLNSLVELAAPLYTQLYNAHPREQKLSRRRFIGSIVSSKSVSDLRFRDTQKNEDYFVYRPGWDGVWYQTVHSPFAGHEPASERFMIGTLHEASLVAMRLNEQMREMRCSGCCLLSKERGSNGSRWFIEDLEKAEADGLTGASSTPANINSSSAASVIRLALGAGHYLQEELREQSEEPNWEPAKITQFACFFIRQTIWLGFLWQKLQLLRYARIKARFGTEWDALPDRTKVSMGLTTIADAQPKLLNLAQTAAAEFGVSNRFWLVRQAAIPGVGWTMLFLSTAAVAWPIVTGMGGTFVVATSLAFIYGIGLVALMEGLVFACILIWGRRVDPPFKPYGSTPPRG